PARAEVNRPVAPATPSAPGIAVENIMRHLQHLADDALEGRGSGEKGADLAADYLAAEFAKYGLEPAGDPASYFQKFEVSLGASLGPKTQLKATVESVSTNLPVNVAFLPFDNVTNQSAHGSLVFAGYGISAPEYQYDDYAGLDARGKIVLLLRYEPQADNPQSVFAGNQNTPHATFLSKLSNAVHHGAAGVLMVDAAPRRQTVAKLAETGPFRMGLQTNTLPLAFVEYAVAQAWLQTAGADLAQLVKDIDSDVKPRSCALDKVAVEVSVEIAREFARTKNVIGRLRGSDPALAEQYVVVGAHYDHIGYGLRKENRGKAEFIHNGADDNASGTSVVLELARTFAAQRPKRSLLLMLFSGEERGLVGSRHYVDHPVVPLDKTVAMVNLDMVGRGKQGLDVGGVGTSPLFKPMVEELKTNFTVRVTTSPGGRAPSDNTSFYNKGLPVLFFYTGQHKDYHRPSDDWQLIDRDEIGQIAQLAGRVVERIASQPEPPKFVKSDGNPLLSGARRVRLGVMIDAEGRGPGVTITEVMPDTPAARAGLKAGDVLKALNEKLLENPVGFVTTLGRFRPGETIDATLVREGQEMVVKITL
ncbi:MAG: M28 family peptidase, partial [Verrucomicrobiota bacterium]